MVAVIELRFLWPVAKVPLRFVVVSDAWSSDGLLMSPGQGATVSEVGSYQHLRSATRHQLLLIPRYHVSAHSAVGVLLWLARRSGTHWQMNCEITPVIGLN